MSKDHIRYDLLVQNALKSVVRKVLVDASRDGLPPDHHFYVSFRTNVAGTKISNRLREKYPEEMTIVLQHQYWDLSVGENQFEVGLSFAGIPERLVVPFDTITGFYDPSVEFGLKFEVKDDEVPASGPTPVASIGDTAPGEGSSNDAASPSPRPFTPRSLRERSAAASAAQGSDDQIARIGDPAKTAKVQDGASQNGGSQDDASQDGASQAAKPGEVTQDDANGTDANQAQKQDEAARKSDAADADKSPADGGKDKVAAEAAQESTGAQVVSLDAFRKKH